jgi:putative transposase
VPGALGGSRSGCSAWERRLPCERTLTDAWLIARIRVMHVRSGDSDGARRVFLDLREEGICVGKERVERRMRIAGLCGYVHGRRGKTTLRVRRVRAASGLVGRDFTSRSPDWLWCADIKEIATWEGRLYLASVLDCFSRAWSAGRRCRPSSSSTRSSWRLPAGGRDPVLSITQTGGARFIALVFGQGLCKNGIARSMGSTGDCFDNAVCESFHAALEKELLRGRSFPTRQEAKTAIFDWIECWYNRERRHSRLGCRSPEQFERDYHERSDDCASGTDEKDIHRRTSKSCVTSPVSTKAGVVQVMPRGCACDKPRDAELNAHTCEWMGLAPAGGGGVKRQRKVHQFQASKSGLSLIKRG